MADIKYVIGDATEPIGEGKKVIVHICNDIGAWGAGFVLALSKKWYEPEERYKNWHFSGKNFQLGFIQKVEVEEDLVVINMIAQKGIGMRYGRPPIDYNAVYTCLTKAGLYAHREGATIHMPRIGCGLAGGGWDKVSRIIQEVLIDNNIDVTVYDLE